jgi:hypothetical protein
VWSLAQIAQAMHTHRADVIVHGACEGPDAWADGLAWTALVTRVPLTSETRRTHACSDRGNASQDR